MYNRPRSEKIRFIKPDVAVRQVRSISTIGNIGTCVLTKQNGKWLVVSFTNVEYQFPPTAIESRRKGTRAGLLSRSS